MILATNDYRKLAILNDYQLLTRLHQVLTMTSIATTGFSDV